MYISILNIFFAIHTYIYMNYILMQDLRRCVVENYTSLIKADTNAARQIKRHKKRQRPRKAGGHSQQIATKAGRQRKLDEETKAQGGGHSHQCRETHEGRQRAREGRTGRKAGRQQKGDRSICQNTVNAPKLISNNQRSPS